MKPTIKENRELLPPEGTREVGFTLFQMLKEIVEYKNSHGLIEKWNRAGELTRNRHWKQKSGKPGLVSANLCYTHRERTKNMLTDNNPTFNVSRMGGGGDESEDYTTKILRLSEFWWNDQEQQSIFEKSVLHAEEMGACVEKASFNPDSEFGGEVEIDHVPLFNIGFYPVKETVFQKLEGIVHYFPMSIRKVKRMWPEHADKIKTEEDVLKEIGDNRREIIGNSNGKGVGYLSTFSSVVKNILNKVSGSSQESDEVLIVEGWVKDYTEVMDGDPEEGEDGRMYQRYRPKYTGNIRRVRACNCGELVLDDMSNPSINPNLPIDKVASCYLYDKFPFGHAQSITDTVSLFGMSDYEQLEQMNIEIDKTISQLTIMKDKAARCKLINPKDSGVPNEHFDNKPGIINPSSALVAQAIGYMKGPEIPAELISALEIYKDFFFEIAGSWDLEQAANQGRDVIAYKALAVLLERASTMLKGKIRNYSKLIRDRGRMFISLAQNWYTEERWITFDDDGEENTIPIKGIDILYPAKITVVSGSTMPRARIQEREEAIALFKMDAIPVDELLKKLDYPNVKNVVKKLQEGPLGAFLEKMMALGTPPPMMQLMQAVAQTDDKQFEKAVKEGKIPTFMQIFQVLLTGKPPEDPEKSKRDMEAAKNQAEIQLIHAKVQTERVNQITAFAGMHFDEESLKQNWAKLEMLMQDQQFVRFMKGMETGMKLGQYSEKGMASNNKRVTQ